MSFPKEFEQVSLWSYQNFLAWLSNCIPFVPWNILKALRLFLKNKIFFSITLALWVEKDRCLAKIFRPGCQKCKSRVQQTLWGKIIPLRWVQFWLSIELSTKENFDFGRKLNNRSVKTAFSVSRGTFVRKQFFWRSCKFYEKIRIWAETIQFLAEDWNRVVKTILFVSRKHLKKNLFSGK